MTDLIIYNESFVTSDEVIETTLDSVAEGSRPVYKGAILAYRDWMTQNPATSIYGSLTAYKKHLELKGDKPVTINRKLSAVRKFFKVAYATGILPESDYQQVKMVENLKVNGQPYGRRLSLLEAKSLLNGLDRNTPKGRRDYAIWAVFLGCGLRRAELVSLRWDQLVEEDGVTLIAGLVGKGKRERTVPVPKWVKIALDACYQDNCTMGYIFLSIDRHGNWGETLSPYGIWYIITSYAKSIAGFESIKPHDLRRSYAALARKSGGELDQIQQVLGHSNVAITQRYINAGLDYVLAAQFVNLGD